MTSRESKRVEHAHNETRGRINACRQRLRQTRAAQKTLRLTQDEAVLAAHELLPLVSNEENFVDSEEVFEEMDESLPRPSRQFTPEVDRRQRLRAR
jgi:predicted metalloprotease